MTMSAKSQRGTRIMRAATRRKYHVVHYGKSVTQRADTLKAAKDGDDQQGAVLWAIAKLHWNDL